MDLAVAIVSALATIAGLAYKIWKQRQDNRRLETDIERWKALAATATKENLKLRRIVADKEVQLAAAQAALASKMSASELATALTELFGGKQAPTGLTDPAGHPPGTAG